MRSTFLLISTKYSFSSDKLFFPYPGNLSKFIHCDIWGKPWESTCNTGEVWSQWDVACVLPTLLNPCSYPRTYLNRLYSHPCDQTQFLYCDAGGRPHAVYCGPDRVFQESVQNCVFISDFHGTLFDNFCNGYVFGFETYSGTAEEAIAKLASVASTVDIRERPAATVSKSHVVVDGVAGDRLTGTPSEQLVDYITAANVSHAHTTDTSAQVLVPTDIFAGTNNIPTADGVTQFLSSDGTIQRVSETSQVGVPLVRPLTTGSGVRTQYTVDGAGTITIPASILGSDIISPQGNIQLQSLENQLATGLGQFLKDETLADTTNTLISGTRDTNIKFQTSAGEQSKIVDTVPNPAIRSQILPDKRPGTDRTVVTRVDSVSTFKGSTHFDGATPHDSVLKDRTVHMVDIRQRPGQDLGVTFLGTGKGTIQPVTSARKMIDIRYSGTDGTTNIVDTSAQGQNLGTNLVDIRYTGKKTHTVKEPVTGSGKVDIRFSDQSHIPESVGTRGMERKMVDIRFAEPLLQTPVAGPETGNTFVDIRYPDNQGSVNILDTTPVNGQVMQPLTNELTSGISGNMVDIRFSGAANTLKTSDASPTGQNIGSGKVDIRYTGQGDTINVLDTKVHGPSTGAKFVDIRYPSDQGSLTTLNTAADLVKNQGSITREVVHGTGGKMVDIRHTDTTVPKSVTDTTGGLKTGNNFVDIRFSGNQGQLSNLESISGQRPLIGEALTVTSPNMVDIRYNDIPGTTNTIGKSIRSHTAGSGKVDIRFSGVQPTHSTADTTEGLQQHIGRAKSGNIFTGTKMSINTQDIRNAGLESTGSVTTNLRDIRFDRPVNQVAGTDIRFEGSGKTGDIMKDIRFDSTLGHGDTASTNQVAGTDILLEGSGITGHSLKDIRFDSRQNKGISTINRNVKDIRFEGKVHQGAGTMERNLKDIRFDNQLAQRTDVGTTEVISHGHGDSAHINNAVGRDIRFEGSGKGGRNLKDIRFDSRQNKGISTVNRNLKDIRFEGQVQQGAGTVERNLKDIRFNSQLKQRSDVGATGITAHGHGPTAFINHAVGTDIRFEGSGKIERNLKDIRFDRTRNQLKQQTEIGTAAVTSHGQGDRAPTLTTILKTWENVVGTPNTDVIGGSSKKIVSLSTTSLHPSQVEGYMFSDVPYTEPCSAENIVAGRMYFKYAPDPHKFIQCDAGGNMYLRVCSTYGRDWFDIFSNTCVDGPVHVDGLLASGPVA